MDNKYVMTKLIQVVKSVDQVHETLITPKRNQIAIIGGLTVQVNIMPPTSGEIFPVMNCCTYAIDAILNICGVEHGTEDVDKIVDIVCCSDKSAEEIAEIIMDAYEPI